VSSLSAIFALGCAVAPASTPPSTSSFATTQSHGGQDHAQSHHVGGHGSPGAGVSASSGNSNGSAATQGAAVQGAALVLLSDFLAENAHETWAEQKLRAGWRPGAVRDEEKRLHPLLVPYVDLSPADQEENRRVADACLTAIADAGLVVIVVDGSSALAAAVGLDASTHEPRKSPAPWISATPSIGGRF